jgi:hypothetical protein
MGVDKLKKETEKKAFHFSATVVDNQTGCVFGISATENTITIIPRYNSTFESYLGFLREVCRLIDEDAELTLAGDERP